MFSQGAGLVDENHLLLRVGVRGSADGAGASGIPEVVFPFGSKQSIHHERSASTVGGVRAFKLA